MQVLKDNLRERILAAARREFCDNGYKNASMRRIAANAGITAGNIYRYYENKDALLQAVIRPVTAEIEKILRESTDGMVGWDFDSEAFLREGRTLKMDLQHFSKGLVDISNRFEEGMTFIANDQSYRSRMKVWLTSVMYVYYVQHQSNDNTTLIRILSSISSLTLIDAVSESLSFRRECQIHQIDASEVVYRCLTAVMNSEEAAA
jgi:AcrR family transcriptional regulator